MNTPPPHVLIFTDLDGTFLDHETYSSEPAAIYVQQLDHDLVTLIPVTSKTRSETASFLETLGIDCPYATENGSIIHAPGGLPWRTAAYGEQWILGKTHADIRRFLDGVPPEFRQLIKGFSDMTDAEVAAATGLAPPAAARAKNRQATEPFIWSGSRQQMSDVLSLVRQAGLTIQQGGRFHHITGNCGKADAMQWIIDDHQAARPHRQLVTIALGDGPNDLQMIQRADHGAIIPNPAGPSISSSQKSVLWANQPGPRGWVEAIDKILASLGLDQPSSSSLPQSSQDNS